MLNFVFMYEMTSYPLNGAFLSSDIMTMSIKFFYHAFMYLLENFGFQFLPVKCNHENHLFIHVILFYFMFRYISLILIQNPKYKQSQNSLNNYSRSPPEIVVLFKSSSPIFPGKVVLQRGL